MNEAKLGCPKNHSYSRLFKAHKVRWPSKNIVGPSVRFKLKINNTLRVIHGVFKRNNMRNVNRVVYLLKYNT